MLETSENDEVKCLMRASQDKLQIMLDYFKCMAEPALQTERIFNVTKKYLAQVVQFSLDKFDIKAPLTPHTAHLIFTTLFWLSKTHTPGSKVSLQCTLTYLLITLDDKNTTPNLQSKTLQHLQQAASFNLTTTPQGWLYTFDLK